jgi:hypothetical protein
VTIALLALILSLAGCGPYYAGGAKQLPPHETATVYGLGSGDEMDGQRVGAGAGFFTRMFSSSATVIPPGPHVVTVLRCVSWTSSGPYGGGSCDEYGDPCTLRFDAKPGGEYWIHHFWGSGDERTRIKGLLLADKPEQAFGVGPILNHGFPNEEQARTQSISHCFHSYDE